LIRGKPPENRRLLRDGDERDHVRRRGVELLMGGRDSPFGRFDGRAVVGHQAGGLGLHVGQLVVNGRRKIRRRQQPQIVGKENVGVGERIRILEASQLRLAALKNVPFNREIQCAKIAQ